MSACVTDLGPEAVWVCDTCGNGLADACGALRAGACRVDAELVSYRLEQAGATLLAMRGPSPYPALYRCALPEVLREAIEAYGWTDEPCRPALPDAADITRMDLVFGWLGLIPQHRFVMRRIVAARSLVSPVTGRHIVTWKRLGLAIGADYRAAQRWHTHGIALIVGGINRG